MSSVDPVISLKPPVIRDRILGALYQAGFELKTREEITVAGRLQGEPVIGEFVHLLRTRLIQAESGPVTDETPPEILQKYVEDHRHRYSITVAGREYLEKKGGKAGKIGVRRGLPLREVPPNLDECDSWLTRANSALSRAQNLKESEDSAGSVSSSQKAIEVSLKALFPAVGWKAPEDHDVSGNARDIIERISGNDEATRLATKKIAKLAVLNRASAFLHEVSQYGFLGVSEKDLLNTHDSDIWSGYATAAVSMAREVVDLFKKGRIKSQ